MEKRGHHKLEACNFRTVAFNMVRGSYDGPLGARRVVSTSFYLYGLQLLRKPPFWKLSSIRKIGKLDQTCMSYPLKKKFCMLWLSKSMAPLNFWKQKPWLSSKGFVALFWMGGLNWWKCYGLTVNANAMHGWTKGVNFWTWEKKRIEKETNPIQSWLREFNAILIFCFTHLVFSSALS